MSNSTAKMKFCPKCGIGFSIVHIWGGYCSNCHYDFSDEAQDEDDEDELKDEWRKDVKDGTIQRSIDNSDLPNN